MTRVRFEFVAPLSLLAILSACNEHTYEHDAPECPNGFVAVSGGLCVFDEGEVGRVAKEFQDSFVRVNETPFTQQFGDRNTRNVWISDSKVALASGGSMTAADIYASIDPIDFGGTILQTLPVGTILIHHNVNAPQFGVMIKREVGALPNQNDWWFRRFEPDGSIVPPDDNPYAQTCMDCHVIDDRAHRTDLLWGVPRDSLGGNSQ